MASASKDATVNVWNTLTLASIQRYTNHTNSVYSLDQIDNDTMVSGSSDTTIRIWKISTGETLKIIKVYASVYVVRVFQLNKNKLSVEKVARQIIYKYTTMTRVI